MPSSGRAVGPLTSALVLYLHALVACRQLSEWKHDNKRLQLSMKPSSRPGDN